jgi:hypothetical protein
VVFYQAFPEEMPGPLDTPLTFNPHLIEKTEMKSVGARRIILGMRWDGGSWDRVPVWCDALLPLLDGVPVHWCFPSPPPGGASLAEEAFIRPLRERLKTGLDTVIAQGFSGAPHPLLAMDELEKELAWSLKNPWLTGTADMLAVKPATIAPILPDFERQAALRCYIDAGFSHIGVPGGGPLAPIRFHGITLFTYALLGFVEGPPGAILRSIRHAIGHGGDAFVMVDLPAFPTTRSTAAFLQNLMRSLFSTGTKPSLLESALSTIRAEESDSPPECGRKWISAHSARAKIALASGYRLRKRKKNEEFRKILTILSPQGVPASVEATETRPLPEKRKQRKKSLLAHMLGDVTLAGKEFDVKLSTGRFCGIMIRNAFILPNIPSSSFITVNGRTYGYRMVSSVSFEEDDGTGLRAELSGEYPTRGGLILEYEFAGENPELRISAVIRYPLLAPEQTLDGSAPLIFTLQELPQNEPALISVLCPDGSEARHLLQETDGWKPIPAMSWSIGAPGKRIILSAAQPPERKWGLCCFRVAKTKGRRMLEANPFGGPAGVGGAAVSGKTENHSLFIGLKNGAEGGA